MKSVYLEKKQLSLITTSLSAVIGICLVLGSQGYMDQKLANTVSGIGTVLLGLFIQDPSKNSNAAIAQEAKEEEREAIPDP